jgi:hypothetical protein
LGVHAWGARLGAHQERCHERFRLSFLSYDCIAARTTPPINPIQAQLDQTNALLLDYVCWSHPPPQPLSLSKTAAIRHS